MKRLLIAFFFAFSFLSAEAARADILLGLVGPLTGAQASEGDRMVKGAEAAVKAINETGGLLGQKIILKIEDDACDPKQAVAAANRLAGMGVAAVIGHFCSGASIPASAVYNEEGILQITSASTNPQLTEQGFTNVFRVCGRDDQQGQVVADYLAKHFGKARIAILHDKSAYGRGIADVTRAALARHGIKDILYDSVTIGDRDFSAIVTKLKQNNADILFYGGYPAEAGLIIRQMRDQGLKTILAGGDALNVNEFWTIAGPGASGTLMSFGPDLRVLPSAASAVKRFRAAGYEPEGYVLYTYAAVEVFAEAVKKAGGIKLPALENTLRSQKIPTVMGELSFDAKGDIKEPAFILYRWEKGTYTPAE